jgi:hypothetical protein
MSKRSVQAYIEEVPSWEGGAHLAGPPLSGMQWLVWSLATAGKFFEGLIVFMGGIALPLVAEQFAMTSTDKGLVTAATLAGILIGFSFSVASSIAVLMLRVRYRRLVGSKFVFGLLTHNYSPPPAGDRRGDPL